MWIADGWNDYEVIDCSEGEKLERWGRDDWFARDLQVICNNPRHTAAGKR